MPIKAKYVHTNLMTRDWRKLVEFYSSVFGCIPKPPRINVPQNFQMSPKRHPGALDKGAAVTSDRAIQCEQKRRPRYEMRTPCDFLRSRGARFR
jgi:predicted enzyme related to lactoylglutathione lyase